MSFFTILITEKEKLPATKKELFKTRQRTLSFVESNSVLDDTKSFRNREKFTAVIVEGYFSSFAYERDYVDKYNGNNRAYLESSFMNLAGTHQVAFGYFFDDIKRRKGFEKEISITKFPHLYQENVLYIFKPVRKWVK